jgi:hypothetical protein
MPAWRQGQAVGEWRQIAGTALSSATISVPTYPTIGSTGPSSKVVAWTGFAVDPRDSSIYSAANGGHGDYAGNEVNLLRLSDNTPRWSEPRPATPPSQIVSNASHYADGRPTARHTYYGSVLNERRDRIMLFSGARWGDGVSIFNMDGFNLSARDWDAARTYADGPSATLGPANGWATVGHQASGDVYVVANYKVLRWSNAANTWTNLASTSAYGQYTATAVDTKRNRILMVGGAGSDRSYYDIASNTATNVTFTGSAAGLVNGTGNGLVYDPLLDAYLLRNRNAGDAVYRIDAETFAVEKLAVSNGAAVPAAINGVWTRFLYVPKLKGVVFFPTYTSGFWFLRTQ